MSFSANIGNTMSPRSVGMSTPLRKEPSPKARLITNLAIGAIAGVVSFVFLPALPSVFIATGVFTIATLLSRRASRRSSLESVRANLIFREENLRDVTPPVLNRVSGDRSRREGVGTGVSSRQNPFGQETRTEQPIVYPMFRPSQEIRLPPSGQEEPPFTLPQEAVRGGLSSQYTRMIARTPVIEAETFLPRAPAAASSLREHEPVGTGTAPQHTPTATAPSIPDGARLPPTAPGAPPSARREPVGTGSASPHTPMIRRKLVTETSAPAAAPSLRGLEAERRATFLQHILTNIGTPAPEGMRLPPTAPAAPISGGRESVGTGRSSRQVIREDSQVSLPQGTRVPPTGRLAQTQAEREPVGSGRKKE